MKNQRILRWTSIVMVASVLSGCSTIKSWFPDKERDYQFTSEIPELIVPEDLKNKGLAVPSSPEPESTPEPSPAPEQQVAVTTEPETQQVEVKEDKAEQANPAVSSAGASSLIIDQAKTPAARMVGRALSRKQIEIAERNIEKGYFYVKFDPNAVAAKDESIWDELTFLFGEDPSQEQEYRISVHQVNEQMSEVTVQDSGGKTLSDAVANALLKLITEGINEVVNPEVSADNPEEPAEQKTPAEPGEQKAPEDSENKQ